VFATVAGLLLHMPSWPVTRRREWSGNAKNEPFKSIVERDNQTNCNAAAFDEIQTKEISSRVPRSVAASGQNDRLDQSD